MLTSNGPDSHVTVNVLLSFAYHSGTDLRAVKHDVRPGLVMIDSGAYTAMTRGKRVTVQDYRSFLNTHDGGWDVAVTLDSIGDAATTRANTRVLWNAGIPVLPVFHAGGELREFDAYCREHLYVCVGGMSGLGKHRGLQARYIRYMQRRAADLGAGVHALGYGSVQGLRTARPYSCDVATASRSLAYGVCPLWTGARMRNVPIHGFPSRADEALMRQYGLPVDVVRRGDAGKLPWRIDFVAASVLSFAYLQHHLSTPAVPGPHGLPDGPLLFSSLGSQEVVKSAVAAAGSVRRERVLTA